MRITGFRFILISVGILIIVILSSFAALSKDPKLPRFIHHFRYDKYDFIVNKAREHNIKVLAVLSTCPDWPGGASINKGYHTNIQAPNLLDKPASYNINENNPNIWANFVYNTVKHYDGSDPNTGKVDAWEAWNEPNLHLYWCPDLAEEKRVYYYHLLLKVTYEAAKKANPSSRVLIGGVGGVGNENELNFYRALFEKIKSDPVKQSGFFGSIFGGRITDGYFDVISVHIYDGADLYGKMIDVFHDSDLDVWITETGKNAFSKSEEGNQSSYLSNTFSLFQGYPKVKKIFWFRLRDDPGFNDYTHGEGLLYSNNDTKDSFDTYKNYISDHPSSDPDGIYGLCTTLNGSDSNTIERLFDEMEKLHVQWLREDFQWSLIESIPPDNIVNTYPENESQDIPVDSEIKVYFEKRSDSEVQKDCYQVSCNPEVKGKLEWRDVEGQIILKYSPAEKLKDGTDYEFTIKDKLSGDFYTWSFKTHVRTLEEIANEEKEKLKQKVDDEVEKAKEKMAEQIKKWVEAQMKNFLTELQKQCCCCAPAGAMVMLFVLMCFVRIVFR